MRCQFGMETAVTLLKQRIKHSIWNWALLIVLYLNPLASEWAIYLIRIR